MRLRGMSSRSTTGIGRLAPSEAMSDCRHTGAVVLAASGASSAEADGAEVSDFLDDMLPQQPRWFYQEDDDENYKRDSIAVLAAVIQKSNNQCLDQPQNERANNRAGDVANAPKDRRHKGFDARQKPH